MTGHQASVRPGDPSDASLVRFALGGDAASLSALLDRYRASLYARALASLARPEDAADAVQETFVIALTRLGQLRDPDAVGGWLHAIVRSVCAMELRRPARRGMAGELDRDVPSAQSGTAPRGEAGWATRVHASYRSLAAGDPGPYAAMFAPSAGISSTGLVVQGRDQILRMCEQDLEDGIGARLVEVVSSSAITVVEAEWVSPPDDPEHCPPAVTQVLFHDGTDQVLRSRGYFHPHQAPPPPQ